MLDALRRSLPYGTASFMLLALSCFYTGVAFAQQRVGWVENVKLYPERVLVKAKLDTGAQTSSIDCECSKPYFKNGRRWVTFSVKDLKGDTVSFDKPVVRVARIKQHSGRAKKRYVVKLGICLGSVYRDAEVTLADRRGFNYVLLIGRNFMRNDFLIDPSATFLSHPNCKVKNE